MTLSESDLRMAMQLLAKQIGAKTVVCPLRQLLKPLIETWLLSDTAVVILGQERRCLHASWCPGSYFWLALLPVKNKVSIADAVYCTLWVSVTP